MKIEKIALVLASVALACSLITGFFVFFRSNQTITPADRTEQANELELDLMGITKDRQYTDFVDLMFNATLFDSYMSAHNLTIPSNASVSEIKFINIVESQFHDTAITFLRFDNIFYLITSTTAGFYGVVATCTP